MNDLLSTLGDVNTLYVWVHIIWACIMLIVVCVAFVYREKEGEYNEVKAQSIFSEEK